MNAKQDLVLNTGHDVNIITAKESDYSYDEKTTVKKGFLSKTTTHRVKEDYESQEKAPLLVAITCLPALVIICW